MTIVRPDREFLPLPGHNITMTGVCLVAAYLPESRFPLTDKLFERVVFGGAVRHSSLRLTQNCCDGMSVRTICVNFGAESIFMAESLSAGI